MCFLNEADAAEAVAARLGALVDSLHAALASTQSLLQPPSEALSHLHSLRSAISKSLMSQVAAQAGLPDRLCHAIFSLLQTLGVCVEFKDVQLQLPLQQQGIWDAGAERMSSAFVEAVFTRAANPLLMPTPPAPNDTLLNNLLALLNLTTSTASASGSLAASAVPQLSASGPPTSGWRLLSESLLLLEQLCARPESVAVPAERWRAPCALLELLSELVRLVTALETSANRNSLRPAARLVEFAIVIILRTLRMPNA